MNIYRSIIHSKGLDTHWLEIDSASIRIPFNEVSDKATDYNVVLFNSGVLVVSLWSSKAKEFMKLWSDEINKDNNE
jgi:type IV secretory pathway TrbL component